MRSSPITRAPWALIALALVAALAVNAFDGPADDDLGAEQMRDAIEHAQRDADERRVAAALKEGRKQ
jgi:hypothetical protein